MQRWTVHLEGGPKRVNHAAVAIGSSIYSFGGYCTGEDYNTTRPMDVYILNSLSLRWQLLPGLPINHPNYFNVPYQRYGHIAVAVGDCAYIWGGRNDKDGACHVLYCFDSATLTWSKPKINGNLTPGARDGHSACVINNKMYIFGGYEDVIDRFSNDVHVFDFETMEWTYITAYGTPAHWRDFHTATAIGNTMFVFGGRGDVGGDVFTNNEIYCNKVQTFDTISNTWYEPVTHGQIPNGRRSHSAFFYEGNLYIFGGYNGHETHYNDMYQLDPVKMVWSKVKIRGQGPCPRRRQCCCRIDSRIFLFGGTSPKNSQMMIQFPLLETDLIDHSDLYVLDFAPALKTLCELKVLEQKLDTSCLPGDLRWELAAITTNNTISRSSNTTG